MPTPGRRPPRYPALWQKIRRDTVGSGAFVDTPFGRRLLTYADHSASGRAVGAIERYLTRLLEEYGNTHTDDDATGRITTERLARAESIIKLLLGAPSCYRIIEAGSGTTGAIARLQQILGVAIPPATRDRLETLARGCLGDGAEYERLLAHVRKSAPVVFVGPYEHHSNEGQAQVDDVPI